MALKKFPQLANSTPIASFNNETDSPTDANGSYFNFRDNRRTGREFSFYNN